MDHAIGDSIVTWGFVIVPLFDFSSKILSRDLVMQERVYWEDGVFYFMEECTYCKVD